MKKNLGCYLDTTYCASPNCKNECGRKMSNEIKKEISKIPYARVTYGYFCGEETYDLKQSFICKKEDLIK